MRKRLLLVALIGTFAAGSLFAQKQLYFGAGGTGLTTWFINQNNYGYSDLDVEVSFSYAFNANVGFDFNNNLGIKLELGFQRLGQNYSKDKADTTFTRDIALNYFQLPLLFKFRAGGEVVKFMGAIGPQFNFLMSANQNYYYTLMDTTGTYDYKKYIPGTTELISQSDIKNRFNSFDIMARLDLGVEFVITKNLMIDAAASFAYGLTDIIAPDYQIKNTSGNYDPVHNAYVGFNVGVNYVLPLN